VSGSTFARCARFSLATRITEGARRCSLRFPRPPPGDTHSELERRFLALIREAGLPEPQANVLVEGFLVDLFWPEARLVVEIDSYGFHRLRREFNSDRYRDAKLQLAGYIVLRVTEERMDNPEELLSDLIRFLSRSRRPEHAADAAASDR
jgi:very-short-patch-repair endonuclease